MSARPEYVCCVSNERMTRDRHGGRLPIAWPPDVAQVMWCGRVSSAFEFHFLGATHALLSAQARDRLMVCPGCADAMTGALAPQTWRPSE